MRTPGPNVGFTVVELLVSLVIFSFGALAAVALLGTGYRYEGQANLETQMTVLTETKIEQFRAIAGTDLPDTVALVFGGSLDTNVSGYIDTPELDGRRFRRRWLVEAGPGGTRQATVRVEPLDPPAAGRSELSTYVIHD